MTRLLCRTLPRLEPATLEEITESFANIDRTLPLSEQMATHRASSPRCLSCHGEIDPIGLALEKYDAKGFWRETYLDGSPIVSDLQLYGKQVGDPMKLASAIEGSEEYRTCVASKVLTYALNRGPLTEEASVSAELATLADGSQPSFKAMIVGAFMKSLKLTEVAP